MLAGHFGNLALCWCLVGLAGESFVSDQMTFGGRFCAMRRNRGFGPAQPSCDFREVKGIHTE